MGVSSADSGMVSVKGVMKAVIQPGAGDPPAEDDQVLFHFTVRTKEGGVFFSTLKEHGGRGAARRAVLGHSRLIPGLDHGMRSMQPAEIAMLRILPEAHFGDPACPLAAPEGLDKEEEMMVEVRLVEVVPEVEVLGRKKKKKKEEERKPRKKEAWEEELDAEERAREKAQEDPAEPANAVAELDRKLITKKVLEDGQGWEQARAPYQVQIRVTAKQAAAGAPYFEASETLHVDLGQGQLPPGLEAAVCSMHQGERAVAYVSELGEGTAPTAALKVPMPPSDGPVQYEIAVERIVQVRDVLGNGQVLKKRLIDGQGEFPVDCPLEDCLVRVHYKGSLPDEGGRVFINTREENGGEPFEFGTGEGMLPEALETSVRVMLPGETALVTSSAAHAYDAFPRPEGVPEGAFVQWEVELISFDKPKRWEGLTFREIMDEVARIKELGNALFKRELYQLARAKYEKMIRELKNVHPQNDDENKEWSAVTMSLQLNVAACYHKAKEYILAIEWADKVLVSNPNHAKALFRRGQAHMMASDFEEAKQDFKRMIAADPSSAQEGQAMLARVRKMEEEAHLKQKRQFKGLFEKNPGLLSAADAAAASPKPEGQQQREANGKSTESSGEVMPEEGGAAGDVGGATGSPAVSKSSTAAWIPFILFVVVLLALVLLGLKEVTSSVGSPEL